MRRGPEAQALAQRLLLGYEPQSGRVLLVSHHQGVSVDRTDQFLGTLLAWCEPGTVREFQTTNRQRFRVRVEPISEQESEPGGA
jgi:hypothetical protein